MRLWQVAGSGFRVLVVRRHKVHVVATFQYLPDLIVAVETSLGCAGTSCNQTCKSVLTFQRHDAAAGAEGLRKILLLDSHLLEVVEQDIIDGSGTLVDLVEN